MDRHEPLFLYEEAILLSLREKEGTVEMGAWYQQAIAGALLSELLLTERIEIREEKRKKFVRLKSSQPLRDGLLDECLEKIAASEKERTMMEWITKFSGIKDLKHRAVSGLCRRNILRADEDKVLLIFTRKIYPEVDPGPEREIVRRLEEAILTDRMELEPRTAVLVSLANHAGLLRTAFDKKTLKERKHRIEEISRGDAVGEAAKGLIESTQAAIVMVAIMPTITN